MKKKLFFVVYLFLIVILIRLIIKHINTSPYSYLQNSITSNIPSEFLYQAEIENNIFLLFYIDKQDNVVCSIVKKGIFDYKILQIVSQMPAKTQNYNNIDYNGNWIYWGIISDDAITKIVLNEKTPKIIDTEYHYRIFYFQGNSSNIITTETPTFYY